MPILLTNRARQRAIEGWMAKAAATWEALGRLYMAAWAAELDGRGDPRITLRWQLLMARVRFYLQRCAAALAALKGATHA